MRCPYCASEVPQEATVCAQCQRDFYLPKLLLQRIERLEKDLAEQVKPLVTGGEKPLASPPDRATPTAVQPAAAAPTASGTKNARSYRGSLLLALVPALVLLLAAHAVLLFVYDVKPLFLRIALIMIPVPFGFALLVWHPRRMGISTVAGFVMALAAVSLMLVTTSRIDNVAVLPQDAREVREVLEFVASIGLAFLTGLLLGQLRYHRLSIAPRPDRTVVFLAQLLTFDKDGELGIIRVAGRIQKMVSTLTPIAAGVASVYAGVKALLGHGG